MISNDHRNCRNAVAKLIIFCVQRRADLSTGIFEGMLAAMMLRRAENVSAIFIA